MNNRPLTAQLTTFTASVLFALMAFCVKLASAGLSGPEILFIRAMISIVVIGAVLSFVYKGRVRIRNLNLLVVRAVFGGLAVLFYFIAISRIPLSSAALLANSYPLFAVIFSAVLIKERTNLDSLLAVLLALGGMVLVLEPRFGKLDIGYFLAIASAVVGGVAVTSIKELRKTDSSWMIALFQMIGAAVLSLFLTTASFRIPDAGQWLLLLLIGVLGTGAQLAFTRPFKALPTAEGSMVAPLYTAIVMVLSVLFLGEVLTMRMVSGALLIFGSMIYLIVREEFNIRRQII
ncbi:MAG: DMT family transporter [Candidatus Saganbacteria bacterium]|nr:DMT family transporter [Candidatus Saganbacteria bacterium]